MTLADNRRGMIQDACLAVKVPAQTCEILLVPALVRDDAYLSLGASAAVVVNGRSATFGIGTNTALAARWLVLDSFVDGQVLAP